MSERPRSKLVGSEEAGRDLRSGAVALVPTDTVVGLVAGEAGLPRLAEIKHRDPDKPVAALCVSAEEAFSLATRVSPLARELARLFWPGPLTLVLDASGSRDGTVGVRVPDHAVVREVLAAYGGPLYATSANLAGEPAPGSLDDVSHEISEAVDLAVAGDAGGGEASAVVDLYGDTASLLRESRYLTGEKLSRLAARFE